MTVNTKYLLSGLTKEQFEHPIVKKLIYTLLNDYTVTGNGITTIRWIEETYDLELLH
jgi:hypothetical protein